MNEKQVIINGINVSSIGFKNLRFETAKYSDGIETIRGFGSQLKQSNLMKIDTISLEFIIDNNELYNIAKIYTYFKVFGILPVQNEYILEKLKTKDNTNDYFLCFLENMSITSLENTSNGYRVNLVLSLFDRFVSSEELKEFLKNKMKNDKDSIADLLKNEDIENIVNKTIKDLVVKNGNPEESDFVINIYNNENINAKFKNVLLNTAASNIILNAKTELGNQEKAQNRYDRIAVNGEDIKPETITIENKHIIQVQLISKNLISYMPVKGREIGERNYLGIGKSNFSIKIIFDESDQDVLTKLKTLSDKNIIDHKILFQHPLMQLFDFYSGDILNISFDNTEDMNGISVTIVFNITGYRYEDVVNDNETFKLNRYLKEKDIESIAGLYFEMIIDAYCKKNKYDKYEQTSLKSIFDTKLTGSNTTTNKGNLHAMSGEQKVLFHNIDDLIYAYASNSFFTTEFYEPIYNFVKQTKKRLQTRIGVRSGNGVLLDEERTPVGDFDKALNFIPFLDTISAFYYFNTSTSEQTRKNYIEDYLNEFKNQTGSVALGIHQIVLDTLISEIYNTKQNGYSGQDLAIYVNKLIYAEFYYNALLFLLSKNKYKNLTVFNSNYDIDFHMTFDNVKKVVEDLFDEFFVLVSDTILAERFAEEVIEEFKHDKKDKKIKEKVKTDVLKYMNQFYKEMTNKFNRDKDIVFTRVYNIFLTKTIFTYKKLFGLESATADKGDFVRYTNMNLISSCLMSILLVRNNLRTDHFGFSISEGMQDIGNKINGFNDLVKISDSDKFFYDYIIDYSNRDKIYLDKFHFKDISFVSNYTPDEIKAKYDNNFIYGHQIEVNKSSHYFNSLIEKDNQKIKQVSEDLKEELAKFSKSNNDYLLEEESDFQSVISGLQQIKKTYDEIEIPGAEKGNFNYEKGIIPTVDYESFFTKENDKTYLNKDMQYRIIGNSDPFYDFKQINKTMKNESNYSPDVKMIIGISQISGIDTEQYIGDVYKDKNNVTDTELIVKNISRLSISKNSKNKIKTAIIDIININNSFFNIDIDNGTFSYKILNDKGKIDIVTIHIGSEVKIYINGEDKPAFLGKIDSAVHNGQMLQLSCTNNMNRLFDHTIEGVSTTKWSLVKPINDLVRNDHTDEEALYAPDLNTNLIKNRINDHLFYNLFKENDKIRLYEPSKTQTSMFGFISALLYNFPTDITNYFVNNKANSILANMKSIRYNLKLGAGAGISNRSIDEIGNNLDLTKNILNVDYDYETYGLKLGGSYNADYKKIDNVLKKNDAFIKKIQSIDFNLSDNKTKRTSSSFEPSQVVCQHVLDVFKEYDKMDDLWLYIPLWIIDTIEELNKFSIENGFGPIVINGGNNHARGYRCSDCVSKNNIGTHKSQHRQFQALDFSLKDNKRLKAFYDLLIKRMSQSALFLKRIRRIEDFSATPTWIHIDTRETNKDTRPYIFKP